MLHHVSLGVSDLAGSARFYDAALGALGYERVWTDMDEGDPDQAIGYGLAGGDDTLAIKLRPAGILRAGPGFHLAFAAPHRAAVDAFHAAALANGGTDNGVPGLRTEYGEHYYAAYIIDPDRHRLEAVINAPAE